MWPYIVGPIVAIGIIIAAKALDKEEVHRVGRGNPDEGAIGTSTEEGRKAKAALPAGAKDFYYTVHFGPFARDKDGNEIFWDGQEWRRP